jgi:hypothetical protein
VIQTGEKSQFGGLKEGFVNVAYHVFTDEAVKNPPIIPAN